VMSLAVTGFQWSISRRVGKLDFVIKLYLNPAGARRARITSGDMNCGNRSKCHCYDDGAIACIIGGDDAAAMRASAREAALSRDTSLAVWNSTFLWRLHVYLGWCAS
jgi:hypothetical protein